MNLAGVDLNLLVALEALLAERSVSRAARRLGLSQPATSHALARLRALFGDPLLVRTARGMEPTPRALELTEQLGGALGAVRGLLAPPGRFEPAKAARRFTLATADQGAFLLLPPLVERLGREAPSIELVVLPTPPDDVDTLLSRGSLDLALSPFGAERPGIRQQPLQHERFVGVLRRDHPLARKPLTLDRYCALDHLVVAPTGRPGSFVDETLERLGRRRRVALWVAQFLVAPHIVARSDLIWTAHGSLARGYVPLLPLVVKRLPIDFEGLVISMRWHERFERDPGHRWLREALLGVAREAGVLDGGGRRGR